MSKDTHIELFCEDLKRKGRSSSTITAYKADLDQFSSFLNEKDLLKAGPKDIIKFQKHLIKENNSTEKTASRKLNSIKAFFKFALLRNLVSKNPALDISYPKIEGKAPTKLSQIEYKAIRDTARSEFKAFAMVELILQTGLKIGELSRLKLEQVKLDSNPPHVFIEKYQTNESRIVELTRAAKKCLIEYIALRPKARHDRGYLFQTRTGSQILPRNIRSTLNRIFKNAGVKNATVNDLRNTFICHQIENGMSLKKLAEIVGHKHTASTEMYLAITERKAPGTSQTITEL
ncbi:tyrosine-type recombinase/integrase [Candidatus Dojkabacteria bacterium]|nr:tyrosine-type recombinase/integrase [Candidatus Dojkabacteria bacterium]